MGKQKWCVLAIVLSSGVAAAAPPKGAYKIVKWIDGKEIRTPDQAFKEADMRGEVVINFDGDRLSAGTWTIAKDIDSKRPEVMYINVCRGEAIGQVKWTGDTVTLAGPIEFNGFVNSYVYTTTKKGKGKDHQADVHTHKSECGYKLDKPSYKVSGAGDKITLTEPSGKQIVLQRTKPIADVDPKGAADDYWEE